MYSFFREGYALAGAQLGLAGTWYTMDQAEQVWGAGARCRGRALFVLRRGDSASRRMSLPRRRRAVSVRQSSGRSVASVGGVGRLVGGICASLALGGGSESGCVLRGDASLALARVSQGAPSASARRHPSSGFLNSDCLTRPPRNARRAGRARQIKVALVQCYIYVTTILQSFQCLTITY